MRYGLRVEPKEGPVTAERVMAATPGGGFLGGGGRFALTQTDGWWGSGIGK